MSWTSVWAWTAAAALAGALVCLKSLLDVRDAARPADVGPLAWIITMLVAAAVGTGSGMALQHWYCGSNAQCGLSQFLALPACVVTVQILSFGVLVQWRKRLSSRRNA
ncbi:MAG TPA: hypothetical protein VGK20_18465 [Candidatus Binatia bacterium]